MKLKRLSVGILSLLLLASCGNKQGGNQTELPKYQTAVIGEQNVELEMVYPVTIKGQEDIEIRPRVDGFIDAIHVDEGSIVKKGQILFSINSPLSVQALTTAQAAVSSAEATVATAELNVERMKPLAAKGIVSQVQLDTHVNSHKAANAALRQAQASLFNASETLKWTKVSSPVDGVVGSIPLRKGSLVNSSNVLTTVANTSNVFAYFSLNETSLMGFLNNLEGTTQAEKIKNTPPIILTLSDGSKYSETGKIETITGTINITTGTANLRAEFPNKNGLLRSGTSGKITIPRAMSNVKIIPQKATVQLQNKILVFKVEGDSVVQHVISTISTPDGLSYVVTEGLNVGDKIVVEGVGTLSNGKKIQAY